MGLIASHSVTVNASLAEAWTKLTDMKNLASWDTGMESIEFDEPFAVGASGRIQLRNGPSVVLKINSVQQRLSYQSEFEYMGTRFIFDHQMQEQGDQVVLNFSVSLEGVSAPMVASVAGPEIKSKLPDWMQNFKTQIES